MDSMEIQKRIDELSDAMIAKGMREPEAQIWLKAKCETTVYLAWKSGTSGGLYGNGEQNRFIRGTVAGSLAGAATFIAEQPDAETAKLNDFMKALGGVIDLGNRNGIEVDFLNPLVETMKRLSENALTDGRARTGDA